MDLHLRLEWISEDIFWKDHKGGAPDYPGVRVHLLRQDFPLGVVSIDSLVDWYNPSTLQRSIAKEAARRRRLLQKPA